MILAFKIWTGIFLVALATTLLVGNWKSQALPRRTPSFQVKKAA